MYRFMLGLIHSDVPSSGFLRRSEFIYSVKTNLEMNVPLALTRGAYIVRRRAVQTAFIRHVSTFKYEATEKSPRLRLPTDSPESSRDRTKSHLQRMPTSSLIRNLMLGVLFTSPSLIRYALPLLNRVANSQSLLLSSERNGLVRFLVKRLIYDHFCAGANRREITKTRQVIKGMGFSGIILCYGREVQVNKDSGLWTTGQEHNLAKEVKQWKDGNFETLDMMEKGDFLGVK